MKVNLQSIPSSILLLTAGGTPFCGAGTQGEERGIGGDAGVEGGGDDVADEGGDEGGDEGRSAKQGADLGDAHVGAHVHPRHLPQLQHRPQHLFLWGGAGGHGAGGQGSHGVLSLVSTVYDLQPVHCGAPQY